MITELFKRLCNGVEPQEATAGANGGQPREKYIHRTIERQKETYKPESVLLRKHREQQQEELMLFVRIVNNARKKEREERKP